MVLESLFNPFAVKKKPWEMFFAGFAYSFIGLLISYLVFREYAGLLTVFLTVAASMPLIFNAIKNEEKIDLELSGQWGILKEHSKVLGFLMYFFLGVVASLTIAYVFLPSQMVDSIFYIQTLAINDVRTSVSGGITLFGIFRSIFFNNLRVLFFCLVFSFLYGLGAIFILTWNASVVAAAMGNLIKSKLAAAGSVVGLTAVGTYFSVTTFSFFRFMTHGVIEIAAYFVAGLAGGIISVAVIKHNLNNENVLYDALNLIFISVGLVIIAAVVEVYVTPIFFPS